ncbi:MAG: CHAT domain-containing protein, partial [Nannocystaceae bacterium]
MSLISRPAMAFGDAEGKLAADEFNRGLTLLRGGDVSGLPVAKKALAELEKAVGKDHPTTKQASAALLMARFQVRGVRLKLALKNTTPTGPKMTSVWALKLGRELLAEGQAEVKAGNKAGITKLEQAYVYILFAVRDPLSQIVAEFSGALSGALRDLGDEARAQAIEDGVVPAGVVPNILLSPEMKTLYQRAAVAAKAQHWQVAAENQEKLVALLERELGEADELLKWWSELALYYAASGRLDEAEAFLVRCETKILARYGASSPEGREFFSQVAGHFLFRGDIARANLFREKVWMLALKAPKNDASVLRDLIERMDSLVSRGQLKEAKAARTDIEGRFAAVGKVDNATRLRLVIVEVNLLDAEGKPAEATKRLVEAEAFAKDLDDRSAKFLYHRTAAEHSRSAGEFPTAGRHFAKAGEVGSISDAITSGMFESAAKMYWAAGRVEDAVANAELAGTRMDALLPTLLISGTDAEKRKQLLFATLQRNTMVSLSADGFPNNGAAAELALRTLVRRKAVVLDALTKTGEVVRSHATATGKAQLEAQAKLRERLASVVYHPSPEQFYDAEELKMLVGDVANVERELAQTARRAGTPEPVVELHALRAELPENGALIEFATYYPIDPKLGPKQNQDPRYAAYILPKSGPVVAVPLGKASEIDGRIATVRKALATPRGKYKQPARGLHDAIVAKLEPHLGNAKHLVIAPSGNLNLVPFAALIDDDNNFVLERYTVTYVSSGRELTRKQDSSLVRSDPVVVGAPAFNDPGDGALATKKKALKFTKLPGTAEEVAALEKVVPKATILTGAKASERRLKDLERPVLLHVATHGFFLAGDAEALAGTRALEYDAGTSDEPPKDPGAARKPSWSIPKNPLLRSGVALAGANKRVGSDDGILTALEVASMDLRGTELVVLSACETGVGEIEAGEGVYGLRRALTLAGTRAQVMSLWKVDDA